MTAPADPREDGPAAQRLEAFLESLPGGHAKTQALIDFGTVLRDANNALRLAARQDEPSPALRARLADIAVMALGEVTSGADYGRYHESFRRHFLARLARAEQYEKDRTDG